MKLKAIILLLITFSLMHNFCKKLVDIDINVNSILSRGILIVLFIKGSRSGICTCWISTSWCHFAFNCNCIFFENYALVEILWRGIFGSLCIKELHGGGCSLEYPMLYSHIVFNFKSIFLGNYVLIRVLSGGIFISVFIKESHGGVHRFECLYQDVTSCSSWKLCIGWNFIEEL
jgi:hypothetical protein